MNVLGIDIGGSTIKAAPVDTLTGTPVQQAVHLPTPQPATPKAVAITVNELIKRFGWKGRIGCGVPAVIRDGHALTAANIDPAWIGTDVTQLLFETCGHKITVLNDADAAGLAEMHHGAGKTASGTTLIITVGTGLGTALFHHKTLVPNTELGHLQLNGEVAEHLASAAVRSRLNLSYQEWAKPFDAYLHRLDELLWPDLYIIGGGISKDHQQFFPYLTVKTRILPATFQNNAGIIGAAIAAQP